MLLFLVDLAQDGPEQSQSLYSDSTFTSEQNKFVIFKFGELEKLTLSLRAFVMKNPRN